MAKGGYQIIDFKKVKATSTIPIAIPGVHEALEGNYGKATLACGIVVGDKEYAEEYVVFTNAEETYSGKLDDGTTISVTSEDMVTFTSAE